MSVPKCPTCGIDYKADTTAYTPNCNCGNIFTTHLLARQTANESFEINRLEQQINYLIPERDRLTKENEALKAEVERQSNVICENVCGDCLEYEDDGTPQTGYGWNENRVEGQYACGCIQESGPYQVLEAERDRLRDGIEYAQKIGDGRIVVKSDSIAVRAIYNHLDDLLALNHKE